MRNTEVIEANLMLDKIDGLTDPKAVLEKLAASDTEMGWGENAVNIRALCYGAWLKKNRPDWHEFFVASANILNSMLAGGPGPDELPKAPDGYIPPMPYLKGNKK